MKILRIASRVSFFALCLGLMLGSPATAQSPLGPVNNDSDRALPAVPVPPLEPTSQAPSTSSHWYDGLFQQKLPFVFGFRLGEVHSDNIYYQPQKTRDNITELSPSVVFTLGQKITLIPQLNQETKDEEADVGNSNYLQITYRPTLTLYAKNSFLDVVDEDANALYIHQFGKLTLSLAQSYEKLSQPTLQTSTQGSLVHRDIFKTTARANYIYSDKLSTYGTATQTINSYISGNYVDNTEWAGDYYFLYQLFPKLSAGLGPRIGFIDIAQASNQTYQDALVHLFFVASAKTSFSLAAGGEIREYEHDSSPTKITPIFEATAQYKPFDSTTITLDGARHSIVSSNQIGQNYTATTAALGVRQRFFQVVFLTLTAGYENDQYMKPKSVTADDDGGVFDPHEAEEMETETTTTGPTRYDNYYFFRSGLEWESFRGLLVDASYQYSRDNSSFKEFRFNENRFILSATVKY